MSDAAECSGLEDGALASLVLDGAGERARAAEAELCKRFAPRIRLYGLRHLGSEHAAADLVQRVLLLLVEKLRNGEVREPERVASFTLGAARRVAQQMRRGPEQRAVSWEVVCPEDGTWNRIPALQGMALPADGADTFSKEALVDNLRLLGERERTVLVLSFYHDQSAREIASTLGMTEGNVRVVRHRAVERLRALLSQTVHSEAEGT